MKENQITLDFDDVFFTNLQKKFQESFELSWNNYLNSTTLKYMNNYQLKIGNRLRPLLTYWGYSLSLTNSDNLILDDIIDLAISVELIHKASIITDDFIDNDSARHGHPSFHIEFGVNETLLFTVHLLGLAFYKINENLSKIDRNSSSINLVKLFSKSICEMSKGALEEINLKNQDIFSIKKITDIINLETVSLIKNSMLMGYLYGNDSNSKLETLVDAIGNHCGYIFQILNDIESFNSIEKNILHKGNANYDFTKSRKNIAIAYIYSLASKSERMALEQAVDTNKFGSLINELYIKYDITKLILDEVSISYQIIDEKIQNILQITNNYVWTNNFKNFIEYIMHICKRRLSTD